MKNSPSPQKISLITRIGFLLSLQIAGTLYIYTTYLYQYFTETQTSMLFVISSILMLILINYTPHIIERMGTRRMLAIMMIISVAGLGFLTWASNPIVIATAFVSCFTLNTLLYLVLDIILDHFSPIERIGKIRGTYLTFLNTAYVLAPLGTGYVLGRFGFPALYATAMAIMVLTGLLMISLPNIRPQHERNSFMRTFMFFMRNKSLRGILWVNFILQFFYAWMVLYAQIYMHETLGLPWGTIGTILSVTLLAFVILQTPAGWIADRFWGEKEFLVIGMIIMGIATIIFPFVGADPLWKLVAIFFATRIGASIIEVTSDSYFFKKIDPDNTAAIGFFRNTYPFAYLLGAASASGILLFSSDLGVLFVILGILIIVSIVPLLAIKDTR